MTITTLRTAILLTAAFVLTLAAEAQQLPLLRSAEVAVTYTTERAKIATLACGCFWLQGGSAEGSVSLFRGLGAAILVTGNHSANIAAGTDLSKIAVMAGPRCNFSTSRWTERLLKTSRPTAVFGEALFGRAHAFDSAFPSSSGTVSSASALSMQFGGGVNLGLAKGFSLRAIELDYVRSSFPNFASNTQNDFRIAVGVSYHLGQH